MFSFFNKGTSTGISLGTKNIQIAQAQLKNGSLTLQQHSEQGIAVAPPPEPVPVPKAPPPAPTGKPSAPVTPPPSVKPSVPIKPPSLQPPTPIVPAKTVEEGARETDKIVAALEALQKTASLSLKRSVVLLNPELVYTQLISFPASSKSSLQASINDAVSRTIPEEFADLIVRSKILVDTKEQILVGVAAIRKDVLQTYKEATTKAKVTVLTFTTAPCAIMAADRSPKPTSFLLVTASLGQSIVTLFHHQWPIDEVILPSENSDMNAIAKAGMDMANEYIDQGIVIDTMLLAGPFEAAPLPSAPTLTLKSIFPNFKDTSWLAVSCASALVPSDVIVSF